MLRSEDVAMTRIGCSANTLDTRSREVLPETDAAEPISSPLPLVSRKDVQIRVGAAKSRSVSHHKSAETPTAGTRGRMSAGAQVLVPKVRLHPRIPEAEYPCHSCVVISPPRDEPAGKN